MLPEAVIDESVATLPGLDGRKMSKSYDNTIPLFEGGAKGAAGRDRAHRHRLALPGEPKDPDSAHLVTIYEAFADADERAAFRAELTRRPRLGRGQAARGRSGSSATSRRCASTTTR